ncbi:MAG TPA: GNAT family N-acetyltransferase [Ktedonobacteraceae bacterium]|nr:GNAT family N-acetyltransferase [Ktedonobacteraceae bacterium]
MNATQRPYRGDVDLSAILALKQLCITPQNVYDRPTTSDLRQLFTPFIELTAGVNENSSWQEALQGMPSEDRYRALTQRFTALWEDANSRLVAFALIAQPGCSLTFQVHPQAQGQGVEAGILAWGLVQAQLIVQTRGTPRDLWCRCHEGEQKRRGVLEAAGFLPLFERDLRLVHELAQPVSPVSLPAGFALKKGVKQREFDAYQGLHQAVFDGTSMAMDYHESGAYQPELDLIAVGPTGQFEAFCLCKIKQVTDSQGERLVGEVGVIGTRPELQRQGLGQALLLTGLRLLQARGATSAYLETSESHLSAQRLFASVGFTHLSSWQWYAKTVEPF